MHAQLAYLPTICFLAQCNCISSILRLPSTFSFNFRKTLNRTQLLPLRGWVIPLITHRLTLKVSAKCWLVHWPYMSTIFGLLSFSLFAFRWPQEECLCHLSTDQKWYSLPKSVGNSSEKATLWSFGSKTAICGIAFRRQWDQYKCQYQMDQWVKFNVLICISFIAFTFRPNVTIVMAKGISRKCFDISPYPTSIII